MRFVALQFPHSRTVLMLIAGCTAMLCAVLGAPCCRMRSCFVGDDVRFEVAMLACVRIPLLATDPRPPSNEFRVQLQVLLYAPCQSHTRLGLFEVLVISSCICKSRLFHPDLNTYKPCLHGIENRKSHD